MPYHRAGARLAVAEGRDVPRRGFRDARRDAASHFIRGASITSLPTQVAPKEAVRRVPAGHQIKGRAASNRDLVAAEPKTQIAICEDDVVALPVACGEMAFRGEALEPVFPQRGPWAVRLELKGAGAVERPLAFVATVKSCVEINQCVGCTR